MRVEQIEMLVPSDNYFNFPSGICFDQNSDRLYITDLHNHRVCYFDMASQTRGALSNSISPDVSLDRPLAIAVTAESDIIVTDAGTNTIYKKCSDGPYWLPVIDPENVPTPSLNMPGSVAVDVENNIYAVDFLNNRFIKIDANGRLTRLFGGDPGYRDGSYEEVRINRPYGICHWEGRIFFVDTDNNCVRYCDLQNELVGTINICESGINMTRPTALAIDPKGNIFICDQRRLHCIPFGENYIVNIIDKRSWEKLANQFDIATRIGHIGAVVCPREGEIYWPDTMKGILYKILISV